MRTSYIFGFLLVICVAITNMAAAQNILPADPVKRKNFLQEVRMARANNQPPPIALTAASRTKSRKVLSAPKESTNQKAARLLQLLADGKNKSGKNAAAPPAYFNDGKKGVPATSSAHSRYLLQNEQAGRMNTAPSEETRNRNHELANERDKAQQEKLRKLKERMDEYVRNQSQRTGG